MDKVTRISALSARKSFCSPLCVAGPSVEELSRCTASQTRPLKVGMMSGNVIRFCASNREFDLVRVGARAGTMVQGAGCRVQGAGCRVQGAGCRE